MQIFLYSCKPYVNQGFSIEYGCKYTIIYFKKTTLKM